MTHSSQTWFPQKSYFLVPLGLMVIYSLMAAESRELLALADTVITPLVNGLHYIGLGVTKPFMDGPMPERYYANLVGIGVWGAVTYNIRTIIWMMNRKWWHKDFVETSTKLVQEKNGWSAGRTWLIQRAFLFFLGLPMTFYALLCLLNSIQGWFVFHVEDMLTPLLVIGTFEAPGMFFAGLLSIVAVYFFYDLRQLLKILLAERGDMP